MVQLLVEQLIADPALAVFSRKRAAALVRGPRVEAVGQESQEIGNRLRFEDDGVDAGLDRFRSARRDGLVDGLIDDVLSVQLREIEMIG